MGQPAAKRGDRVGASDMHIVIMPGSPPYPSLERLAFSGVLSGGLSTDVNISGLPAATVGSVADNTPPHLPVPGVSFQRPPSNKGIVQQGSATVMINGKPAARAGDKALTCNDPVDLPAGTVAASGSVFIG